MAKHFLSLLNLTPTEISALTARAIELKALQKQGDKILPLLRKNVVMMFDKSSTRTRVSFETGVTQFGGSTTFLAAGDSQLGRGETLEDTARVLSRLCDMLVVRTGPHSNLTTLAEYASIPVINALSDFVHPCQQLADIQTFQEHRGDISGARVAWVGDGNNVCHSWMNAARQLNFKLHIATPQGFEPDETMLRDCAEVIELTQSPQAACEKADIVVTDTWASMGQEDEKLAREAAFAGFCVDDAMMALADKSALFMHCLPAYRGHEVSESVLEGQQSVIWDQAENRLHAQKALMEHLIGAN